MPLLNPSPTLARLIVSVAAIEAARTFYEEHIGLTVTRVAPNFAWLRTSDGVEVLLHERPTRPSDTGVALGLRVNDLDAVVTRWVRQGGRLVDPPVQQPWGELMAVVRDADGHLVCLSERPSADRTVGPVQPAPLRPA